MLPAQEVSRLPSPCGKAHRAGLTGHLRPVPCRPAALSVGVPLRDTPQATQGHSSSTTGTVRAWRTPFGQGPRVASGFACATSTSGLRCLVSRWSSIGTRARLDLEGPALAAGGGRLLGGLAAPAGRALARKVTFRWRVWLRVRKRVDFPCRWWTYQKWLEQKKIDSPVLIGVVAVPLVLVQRGVSSLMVRGVTMWHAGDASGAA
jgi:hypothetical protein